MTSLDKTALEETVSILDDLIACPTVSTDSNMAMINDMAGRLEDCGARVEIMEDATGTKANLFATMAPDDGSPDTDGGIILSGHSDVVPVTDQDWTHDPFRMTEEDGLLYGRGTADMKGFIAASLAFARHMKDQALTRPLHFAFTHDEETGCLGAQDMIPELHRRGYRPAMAIIGEPTEMQVIEGHKGCCEYTTRFTGQPGHGSNPEGGVNAAEYAARYIMKLIALRQEMKSRAPDDSPFTPPYTSMNIGGIRGGVAHNVIAPSAEVDWEFRPINRDDFTYFRDSLNRFVEDTLLPEMKAGHDGAEIITTTIGEVEGLQPMDENEAKTLMMALTGSNTAGLVAFGTEAGLFQAMGRYAGGDAGGDDGGDYGGDYGLSAVVCGPGSIDQAHKADEFISIDQLASCLTMLDGLGRKIT